jgi:aminoglycoside phosphotransferase (APT) family kinase protein
VHTLLSDRYAAPRMAGWLRIPDSPLEGPVFEHIDGATPQGRTAGLIESIAPLLTALHADADLAARIATGPPRPCRDTFARTCLRRFREDLELVRAGCPPFVSAPLLAGMEREIDALDRASATHPAFAEVAATPAHADLWLNNLLVDGERLWVLDWDDLSIGDPALDWATVLGPTRADLTPADVDAIPADARTDGVAARLPLYARASLFDWLLDPLADWIAADEAPGHAATVRAEKERLHHAALALYRRMYGGV